MIEPPISEEVIMYLINAIYFNGEWSDKFDKNRSFTTVFNNEQGKEKEIIMMEKKGDIEYLEWKITLDSLWSKTS